MESHPNVLIAAEVAASFTTKASKACYRNINKALHGSSPHCYKDHQDLSGATSTPLISHGGL